MLNHDIIEWESCVTISVCLVAAAAMWVASDQSHHLHELLHILLAEIMKKGLTTIFFPYIFHVGHLNYRTLL